MNSHNTPIPDSQLPNYKDVFDYVHGCIDGTILANKDRIAAMKRFLKDIENPEYDFLPKRAEYVIKLIETTFIHVKGDLKGKPFLLVPWEKFILYNIAGFYLKDKNVRRFTESFIFLPRKSGKTPFVAAVAWAFSLLDKDCGSTCYLVGNALDQALQSFEIIHTNVLDNGLGKVFRIHNSQNAHSIERKFYNSKGKETGFIKIKALASNPDRQDSYNCNLAIVDEIHSFKKPKQYTLFREAMKAYTNKHLFGITTAGDNINSFCYSWLKYCKEVVNGTNKHERLFVFICQADNPEDYTNPLEHERANPSYGVTVKPEDMLQTSIQAQDNPVMRNEFLNKELNVYTASIKSYFDVEEFRKSDAQHNYTMEALAKLPIRWAGAADLSIRHDLTAVCLYGEYKDVGIILSHGFIPITEATRKGENENIPVLDWEEMDWLTLCNSPVIEYYDVVKWFVQKREQGFKITNIGYDARLSKEFVSYARAERFKTEGVSQRWLDKTVPFRRIEIMAKQGKLCYLGNRAFEYCVGNVKGIDKPNNYIQYEKVGELDKIDYFDVAVMGCSQWLYNGEKVGNSEGWFDGK